MSRTHLAVLVSAALLALTPFALAEDGNSDSTPSTCDSRSVRFHKVKAKGLARAIYAEAKWRDSTPARKGQHSWFRWHLECLEQPRADRALRSFKRAEKRVFYRYRGLRRVAGYNCGGRWSWWSIPCYIIECESHFSWSAANSSGAVGPYQLLGWGAPFPVNSWRDKMSHHRIAASLSLSNWVCA